MRKAMAAGVLLMVAILVAGCGSDSGARVRVSGPAGEDGTAAAASPGATAAGDVSPTSEPVWPITIAAVGDMMLARSVAAHVTEENPAGPFVHVRDWLSETDLAVGNVETAIGTAGAPVGKAYTFQAPPLSAEGLAVAGFDVGALANNHAMDYGPEALLETRSLMEAAGVLPVGAGANSDEANAPAFVEVRGQRFAFLSFNETPVEVGRGAWEAGFDTPGVAWWDGEASTAAIRAASEEADVVVVFLHSGVEWSLTQTWVQEEISRAAIDAGADIVLGTHAHVMQPVEEYNGGLIAYSLGNFVFDGFWGDGNVSGVLFIELDESGVAGWELRPAWIGEDGLPRPGTP